jgi:hypothetical protein
MISLMRAIPLAVALTLGASGTANALSFNFSFSNVWGTVDGTVIGRIELDIETSSYATAVFVTGYPVDLGSYAESFDVLSWIGSGGIVGENSFTVVNGAVTDGNFQLWDPSGNKNQLYINSTFGDGTNFLVLEPGRYVGNSNGMGEDGVTFAAAVPEPETSAMMLAGLGLLGVVARRRKQKEATA